MTTTEPRLETVLNLTRFHREHEKYRSESPREQAVALQRHARTLLGLADQWSSAEPSHRTAPNPFEGAGDLDLLATTQPAGVLFLVGEGRPPEITRIVRELRTQGGDALTIGDWLAQAMQASWDTAVTLLPVDGLADVMGERHRIITNDWHTAALTTLSGRLLLRAADMLDGLDLTPAALQADLAGTRRSARTLYSAAELVGHAADLISEAAAVQHDSERRWRVFRERVAAVVHGEAARL